MLDSRTGQDSHSTTGATSSIIASIIASIALRSLARPTTTPTTTAAGAECGRHMDCNGSMFAATMATRACSVLIELALLKRIAIDATPATILIWPVAGGDGPYRRCPISEPA